MDKVSSSSSLTYHTHAVVELELRARTETANATAARASLPMDPWVVEALREEFLEHGAVGLGIDVKGVEIVLKSRAVQVDIHLCSSSSNLFVSRI